MATSVHVEALRGLRHELDAAGFLEPSWRWIPSTLFWLAVLAASYTAMLLLPSGLPWLALSPVVAVAMLRMGFLGHDAGHYALSRRPWVNDLAGQIGMGVIDGMSFGFWRHRHNQHHSHCQQLGAGERQQLNGDPDMHFGVLFSVYPESDSWKTPLGRFFLKIQKWSFWPLSLLYWVTLRYDGVRDLFQQPKVTRIDRFFLPMHFVIFWFIPMYFVGVGHTLAGYALASCMSSWMTAAVFVPNHIGMRRVPAGVQLSYLEQQVTTSRNVGNPALFDFFFGGLNFQIEHHLFPRVASHKLRAMAPIVRRTCAAQNLEYREQPFVEALGEVGAHLGRMTAAYEESRRGENAKA